MPFAEHLRELRTRLRNAIIALLVATAIAFNFSETLLALLLQPLSDAWKHNGLEGAPQMNFGALFEPFFVYFKLSIYAGVFVASPFIFHQIWGFIAPGLYEKEKRVAVPFAICSGLFFTGGALFCYFLVFPAAFNFALGYSTDNLSHMQSAFGLVDIDVGDPIAVRPMLLLDHYLSLTTKMLLGFGLVFELPLLIFFMSYVGVVTHRGLWKFNKYAIIISFVVGAILTPGPDIISQLLMAAPLVVLYNLSIIVAWIVTRRREKRAAIVDAGGDPDEKQK